MISALRQAAIKHLTPIGLQQVLPRFDGALSLFVDKGKAFDFGEPEAEFTTSDGRKIPVFPNYRYSVKLPQPRTLYPLQALERKGLLTASEAARLKAIMGTRTVTEPKVSQLAFLRTVAARLPDLFLPGWESDPEGPVLRQPESDVTRIVGKFQAQHERMLRIFAAVGIFKLKPGASVLEIGFTTGGHSIFAFEKLGYKVFGVDNFYDGLEADASVWQSIKTQLNSKADFRVGDITKPTSYEANSLDMVFSASTVEHILDLPAAFAEMYRILKPGGAIVHNFSPYYCADGGHMLGIGDAPWGHVRMSRDDFFRYVREFRPYEADDTVAWFADGLQVDMPQRRVQRYVSEAGFRIGAWMAKPSSKRFMQELTADVMRDCFIATPEISIDDLMARSVNFIAIKD